MKKIGLIACFVIFGTNALFALGTEANTTITNSATLSFSAGGVKQNDVNSNTDSFVVDKKIDMVLSTTDTDQIEVTPGQTDRVTSYTFTNEGNSQENFKFEVANLADNEEADYNDKKDNQDVKNLRIEYSTDGGSNWNYLPSDGILSVDMDANIKFMVKADIKTQDEGAADTQVMNVELKATAYKDDKSGPEEETTDADTQDSVDIVFADGESVQNGANSGLGDTSNSKGDTAGDGIELARSGYIIKTPVLSATKSSCVLSDPVNDTNNPKRIPGAIIRYMFDIENSGTGDVSDLNVSDTLNDNLDLSNTQSSAKKDENVTSCDCGTEPQTDISSDTTIDNQDVKITKINVPSGKHTCVSFEVEIK